MELCRLSKVNMWPIRFSLNIYIIESKPKTFILVNKFYFLEISKVFTVTDTNIVFAAQHSRNIVNFCTTLVHRRIKIQWTRLLLVSLSVKYSGFFDALTSKGKLKRLFQNWYRFLLKGWQWNVWAYAFIKRKYFVISFKWVRKQRCTDNTVKGLITVLNSEYHKSLLG